MKFNTFLETYKIGKSYPAPDGTYKGECVSLVKCYIKDVLGTEPKSIGNAKEYWLKRKEAYIKSLFKPLKKGATIKKGDVFIRTSGTYGHIGIVISTDKDGFFTIEQNAKGCRVVKHLYHPYAEDIHFLRPLNQRNISNKPSVKVGKVYYFTTRPYLYKNTKREPYLINELCKLSSEDRARLKSGTKLKPETVEEVNGDVWVTFKYNKHIVYCVVYNGTKDKAYIK